MGPYAQYAALVEAYRKASGKAIMGLSVTVIALTTAWWASMLASAAWLAYHL
jgi:hypothetical protein